MDVKTAFLYGGVQEDIYINQLTGYDDTTSRVCKLKKALYGLKQSPQIWYNTLATFLRSQGMKPINADLSVFAKEGLIIAIYVDDLLLTGFSVDQIKKAKLALSQKFYIIDLGERTYYPGMTVTRDRQHRIICLGQKSYLEKMLRDHEMWTLPIDAHTHLMKVPDNYKAPNDF